MLLAWHDLCSLGRNSQSLPSSPLERFPRGQSRGFMLELFGSVPSAHSKALFSLPSPPLLIPITVPFLIYQWGAGKSLTLLVNQSKTSGPEQKTPSEPQIMGVKGKCAMAEGTWSKQRYFLAVCSKVWYHFSPGLQGLSPHKFGPV